MPTATEVRAGAVTRGQAVKKSCALTAVLCAAVAATLVGVWFPSGPGGWLAGFFLGLVWANGFEYVYHRFLLHLPGSFFARPHLLHHRSLGAPDEAEHIHLAGSPFRIVLLFVANGAPLLALDRLFGLGLAPGVLIAFAVYLVAAEEIHWRMHLGGWLPPGFRSATQHHLSHHERPDRRFNIFLPLFDRLLRTR